MWARLGRGPCLESQERLTRRVRKDETDRSDAGVTTWTLGEPGLLSKEKKKGIRTEGCASTLRQGKTVGTSSVEMPDKQWE